MVSIFTLVVGPLQANCFLLSCPRTGETAIIDPGGDPERIRACVDEQALRPCCIINTHAHPDHTAANAELKRLYGIPLWIHADGARILAQTDLVGEIVGISFEPSPPPDRLLRDGEEIRIGTLKLSVLHTPGHSPGGICLFLPAAEGREPVLFTGDTVFAGSVGRTDLPGGSSRILTRSIREKILPLPANTRILAGHGPESTLEREREYNPYF